LFFSSLFHHPSLSLSAVNLECATKISRARRRSPPLQTLFSRWDWGREILSEFNSLQVTRGRNDSRCGATVRGGRLISLLVPPPSPYHIFRSFGSSSVLLRCKWYARERFRVPLPPCCRDVNQENVRNLGNCLSLLLPSQDRAVLVDRNRKKERKRRRNLGKQFLFKSGCKLDAAMHRDIKGGETHCEW